MIYRTFDYTCLVYKITGSMQLSAYYRAGSQRNFPRFHLFDLLLFYFHNSNRICHYPNLIDDNNVTITLLQNCIRTLCTIANYLTQVITIPRVIPCLYRIGENWTYIYRQINIKVIYCFLYCRPPWIYHRIRRNF